MNHIELLALANQKKDQIKRLRAEVKRLRVDLVSINEKRQSLRKNAANKSERKRAAELGLGDEWAKMQEQGLSSRDIVAIYHHEKGCTLKQIGEALGVSQSRARQIRERSLARLRRRPHND